MARNGSGSYSNPYPNFISGTVISSTEVDANNSDIATALTQSIAVDGQSVVTGDIPLATHKFTAMKVGSAATDSLSLGQAQAEAFVWCGTASGGADAITLAPSPAITAYAAGQRFVWMASGSTNTGATTVAISGLSAIALQDNGAALSAGQHAAGKMFMGILNTTSTVQIMQVQVSGTDPLIVSSLTVDGNSQFNGTITAGVDDTGYDVKFFGATSGAYMLWDESADDLKLVGAAGLTVAGATDLDGSLDVDGITNLDAVDIDGAVQIDSTVTVGVDDTGYDVKFFGATASAYMLWDESADDLILAGAAGLTVAGAVDFDGSLDVDGTTNLDAVDIDGAVQIDGTVTVGVDDTGYDVKFFGATAGAYMLWDENVDDLLLKGAAQLGIQTSASPADGFPLQVLDPSISSGEVGDSYNGFAVKDDGSFRSATTGANQLYLNDASASSGTHNYIVFRYQGSNIGDIDTTNNSTIRYNTFTGAHWTQFQNGSQPDLKLGTVLSTIDELLTWTDYSYTESNGQTETVRMGGTHSLDDSKEILKDEDGEKVTGTPLKNQTAERLAKCEVSSVAGDPCVYGVFSGHYKRGDTSVESLGAGIILIASGISVSRGDLLESAGDGTAKPQSDLVVKSSTIAKVTSTIKTKQYDDGSYCVPCTLMCG